MTQPGHSDVRIGETAKYYGAEPKPIHLVAEIADRYVVACGVSQGAKTRQVPFETALHELSCGKCRSLWQRVMKMRSGSDQEALDSSQTAK
jgi:hypothetical protein